MVENCPAECAGDTGAINTKLSKQYSISKGGATAGQPATDFTDGTDSNRTASLTPSRQGAKGTAETTKCAKSAKGIGFGVRRQAKRDAALDRERDSRNSPATDPPRGQAWFHGWHGFGMGSGQPKRCRGRWPCHRSPKGTVGTGGGGKLRKSRKARNRKFLEGQAPSCPVCGSGSDSRTAQLRISQRGGAATKFIRTHENGEGDKQENRPVRLWRKTTGTDSMFNIQIQSCLSNC